MGPHMSVSARRELALRTAVRYKNAARPEKKRFLGEFLASIGSHQNPDWSLRWPPRGACPSAGAGRYFSIP